MKVKHVILSKAANSVITFRGIKKGEPNTLLGHFTNVLYRVGAFDGDKNIASVDLTYPNLVANFIVLPEYRNQNIGSKLFEYFLNQNSIKQITLLRLVARPFSKDGMPLGATLKQLEKFYMRYGFDKVADSHTSIIMVKRQ